jgi:hypothetical protein
VFVLKISVINYLGFLTHEYVNILRTVLIESIQKMLLYSTATFKKTSFQTYFNQVSLGCRHSGVNTPDQPRREKKKSGAPACSRNLKIWVVKK